MESDDYFEAWEAQPKPRTYDEREERRLEKREKAAAKHCAVEMQKAPSATSSAPKPPLAASRSIPAPRTVATMFAQQKRACALSLDDDIEEIISLPGAPLKRIRTDPPARSGEEIELSSSDELADEEEEPVPEQVEELELQKPENFVVLFGKQDPKENTSGDRKITVFECIAETMFPEDFKLYAKTLGSRVKGKTEDLCKIYKEKAAHLHVTGGGLGAPEEAGVGGGHEYLDYYIPQDGPHHDTPAAAVNL
ncbi:hypothetical protein B0H10DRAFT_2237769 [Mycena sp. CBHHK59/15]|nr:hypothetical protein B0H10DRAFT_2237769 [Mycena sp. CBHHK59/15]